MTTKTTTRAKDHWTLDRCDLLDRCSGCGERVKIRRARGRRTSLETIRSGPDRFGFDHWAWVTHLKHRCGQPPEIRAGDRERTLDEIGRVLWIADNAPAARKAARAALAGAFGEEMIAAAEAERPVSRRPEHAVAR